MLLLLQKWWNNETKVVSKILIHNNNSSTYKNPVTLIKEKNKDTSLVHYNLTVVGEAPPEVHRG